MSLIVDVPVTLHIAVSFPEGQPIDAQGAAAAIAAHAAEHFAHVSQVRIAAFNEVNRIHPYGAGIIETVTSTVHAAVKQVA
ncbi:MAG TPA: hypothetical protein VD978_19885 [Azospirillum sp.]|nr:hypothetical protein [Azospirillum sp.]